MSKSLPKIGLLGGGQLGRMLLQAAIDLDLQIACLDPDPEASCHTLTTQFTQGSFQDYDTVYHFGKQFDLISIEIEHVNIEALEQLHRWGGEPLPLNASCWVHDTTTQPAQDLLFVRLRGAVAAVESAVPRMCADVQAAGGEARPRLGVRTKRPRPRSRLPLRPPAERDALHHPAQRHAQGPGGRTPAL